MAQVTNIQREARARWGSDRFIETVSELPRSDYPSSDWVPYEDYMRALLIQCTPGELGQLLVDFPADSVEDNRLHVHPISDRLITVIRGSGTFIAVRQREICRYPLKPGTRVWMPRGILHTFLAGSKGLLVESFHTPWVPLEDPKCLVYPSKRNWTI